MNIFKAIGTFFKDLFGSRSARIKAAEAISKAMLAFSKDTTALNIITYVLDAIAPSSSAAITTAKTFLIEGAPILFNIFDIMNASDNSTVTETNIENVYEAFNKLGTVISEDDLKACIIKFMENDNKLSFLEAYNLVKNNLKS